MGDADDQQDPQDSQDRDESPEERARRERAAADLAKTRVDFSDAEFRRPPGTAEGEAAVEVAYKDGVWGVRRGGDPGGPVLRYTQAEWDAFRKGVEAGEFD